MTQALLLAAAAPGWAREGGAQGDAAPPPAAAAVRRFEISEFLVEGPEHLTQREVESAVLPFMGPGRELADVERARVALEKAYSDKGYQSVTVAIPPQTVRNGVVRLKVTEGKVARLRVRGSRYFSIFQIKRLAPSMAEGELPDFDRVLEDIYALNQNPDRRVTPAIRQGTVPGTVDVDLVVQDTLPLHGSVEVNDRYSLGTTHTRLNGAIRWDNLWQAGHSIGASFQIAPSRPKDGKVFAGSYVARFPSIPWLSIAVNGVLQDSDVSTLGGAAVRGRGRIVGARAQVALPSGSDFFQSISVGADWKLFLEDQRFLEQGLKLYPVRYWPFVLQYSGTWIGKSSQTTLSTSISAGIRGLSSDDTKFDDKRFRASGNFIAYRGEVTHTHELPAGLQGFARVGGQYAPSPLVGPEQYTAGGADSVRGYLEVEASGDSGVLGTLELRSPSFAWWGAAPGNEWRVHVFSDLARTWIHDALPEQKVFATLWGVGAGTGFKVLDHLNGSLDVAVPLRFAGSSLKGRPHVHFRLWGEF